MKPIDGPPIFVDTASDLAELCDLLKKEKEVAVDLEVSGDSCLVMMIMMMMMMMMICRAGIYPHCIVLVEARKRSNQKLDKYV